MSFLDSLPDGEPLDGKYAIGRRLAQRGMGAVYEATHVGTKRTVAVKVIHPKFSGSPEFVERFRREAEASGRLPMSTAWASSPIGCSPVRPRSAAAPPNW